MKKKIKNPWPTKAVMEQIYEQHLWGGKDYDFYSGIGSHHPNTINPYLDVVINLLKSKNNQLTVCDLGCGDFNIGKYLFPYTKKYTAIDIVESLIERNKANFKAENLSFQCLDIAKDNLPHADFVILRQVLQHLSNKEIQQIVSKLKNYKYIILTEHLPVGEFEPNKDIISGQGIRLKHNSGVDLLAEPFSLVVEKINVLTEVVLDKENGKIVTILFTL